ncbi:MAG: type IV toxin-antitoxin system AbiEi family antitoxin domain-containing protein [Candidatus Njordarchaeia archaeon]
MPKIKYKSIVESALSKPVFTSAHLIRKGMPRDYVKIFLHRLLRRGVIYRVERGTYATVDDPIIVAGNVVFPSYLSMYIALYLRGVLYQVPSVIQVVTTRRKKNKKINFLGNLVEFYRIKKEYFFGFEYIPYDNFEVPVANVEKAIVDLFYFQGGIAGTIDTDYINIDKLKKYLGIIDRKSLRKKVMRWLKSGSSSR